MKGRNFLMAGAVLMIVLGLARGAGGLFLLIQGSAADPAIRTSQPSVMFLGTLLAALGLGLITSAVYVIRRSRRGWVWAVWLVVTFVTDGMVNGYVFFGRPGDRGTIVNVLAAALILVCLFFGRGGLHEGNRQAVEST
jgi:uncharacterized membrane protein